MQRNLMATMRLAVLDTWMVPADGGYCSARKIFLCTGAARIRSHDHLRQSSNRVLLCQRSFLRSEHLSCKNVDGIRCRHYFSQSLIWYPLCQGGCLNFEELPKLASEARKDVIGIGPRLFCQDEDVPGTKRYSAGRKRQAYRTARGSTLA